MAAAALSALIAAALVRSRRRCDFPCATTKMRTKMHKIVLNRAATTTANATTTGLSIAAAVLIFFFILRRTTVALSTSDRAALRAALSADWGQRMAADVHTRRRAAAAAADDAATAASPLATMALRRALTTAASYWTAGTSVVTSSWATVAAASAASNLSSAAAGARRAAGRRSASYTSTLSFFCLGLGVVSRVSAVVVMGSAMMQAASRPFTRCASLLHSLMCLLMPFFSASIFRAC